MRVPENSIVAQAFNDPWASPHIGREPLEIWETSSGGPVGYNDIHVEAVLVGDNVWSLIHIASE